MLEDDPLAVAPEALKDVPVLGHGASAALVLSRGMRTDDRASAAIPFTVIGGFLGAGKTTLLNRCCAQAAGRRFAVLVNDFGALNIDAALIEGVRRHDRA